MTTTRPSRLHLWGIRLLLRPLDALLHFLGPRYRPFFWVIVHTPAPVLATIGRWRAERAVAAAVRDVPAYAEHLRTATGPVAEIGRWAVPTTDKASYVKAHPIDARCRGGALAGDRITIDESSGSTGTPYNWVRTAEERVATHVFISHFARYCFGDEPFIAINGFSMGAWATGLNMGAALERNAVVKNTGPDVDKIFKTLEFLGKDRRYLICGYPPFLKHMIDEADDRGFPLREYRLMGLVGGEGISEGLRDYLAPVFSPVYSGYGATDIEIGMSGETPLTVAIRRLARENPEVRRVLFGDDSRLPNFFQYNPLQHWVEVNSERELIFTISRLEVLAPRIAYNIHDEGGAATFDDFARRLASVGYDIAELAPEVRPVPLPFLWVYGRSDATVSVMGANIYPEDLEQVLYDSPELAAVTESYCLGSRELEDGTIRPVFSFEVTAPIDDSLHTAFAERMVAGLRRLNMDFGVAYEEHAEAVQPEIQLYPPGEGPFARDAGKIKQTRILRTS